VNRRAFLTRASVAVVGACVATKIPTAWLPAPVKRYAATEFLTRAYNAATKGRGWRWCPSDIYVGDDLFYAFLGEHIARTRNVEFAGEGLEPRPLLKTARLHRSGQPGWVIKFPLPDGSAFLSGRGRDGSQWIIENAGRWVDTRS
jgi:hypothetical protein